MRLPGRTERRLQIAIALVAVLPLVASLLLARSLFDYAVTLFHNDQVGAEVEASLGVYNDLAKAMKEGMRAKADAIAAQEPLRAAAILRHTPSIEQELAEAFRMYPDLVSLTIKTEDGKVLGEKDRKKPVDEATERALTVQRTLSDREDAPQMIAVFAAPRARLDYVEHAAAFLQVYRAIDTERVKVERVYFWSYAGLVLTTLPMAVLIGTLLARQVTRRIEALALATRAVGGGDLSVRVEEEGRDEVTDLARAFNRMVAEVEESRARIEFLRRMGTWQEMARRLAHEIKNPLTPIQLAVQECHRRYDGDNPAFRKLLDTTREIVEEEVGTLRRLVGEFSNFARLPRAELVRDDLGEYLRDQRDKLAVASEDGEEEVAGALAGVSVEWKVPEEPMPVALDRLMLHRVLVNVVGNAAQAIRGRTAEGGRIRVTVNRELLGYEIDVDDDGPGVPVDDRARIFDPYVTTKDDGTGLGLAIVKKILVEHGGTVEALESPLGGARIRIRLPRTGTAASDAALVHESLVSAPPSSRRA